MSAKTIKWDDVRSQVLANPEVKAEYEALEFEFNIASQVIAQSEVRSQKSEVRISNSQFSILNS
ncbi:hypothetical protein [Moorena sp. SIO3I6]|uniref:hypothetical protein n=2 Tax=Moorena TaxID=1155738 RepID=UPI0013F8099B|nr:hypothetical protein [Moorena sp. SIO3I6]NEP28313.1 hypothetical protein [Moorena sp. SIO3I6]